MAADLTKPLAVASALLACLAAAACAELGPEAYDPTTAPPPVLAAASSSSHDMFGTPDAVPAGKVFKDGESTGEYRGQDYVCGNPDCTIAVKAQSSPPPSARDNGRR